MTMLYDMDEQSPHRVASARRGIRRFVRERAASSHFPRRVESPRFVFLYGDDPRRRLTRSLVVGRVARRPLVAIRFVPITARKNDRVALTPQGSPRTTQGATGGRGMFSRIEIRLSRALGTPETTHTVRRCIEY